MITTIGSSSLQGYKILLETSYMQDSLNSSCTCNNTISTNTSSVASNHCNQTLDPSFRLRQPCFSVFLILKMAANQYPTMTSSWTTLSVFALTIFYFKSQQSKRNNRQKSPFYRRQLDEEIEDENTSHPWDLSQRGQAASTALNTNPSSPQIPSHNYWSAFLTALSNPYHVTLNPHGWIALCLAEQKLSPVVEALAVRLMEPGTAVTAFSHQEVFEKGGFLGLRSARVSLALFLETWFWKPTNSSGGDDIVPNGDDVGARTNHSVLEQEEKETYELNGIDPDHVVFGSGVGSLLSHLCYSLCRPGHVILIPAPYYSTFQYHVSAVAQCIPHPVYMDNPMLGPTLQDLERATKIVERQGNQVKCLLLTNPNDPLGVVYRPNVMKQIVQWARGRNIHTIVDEVFALTIHQQNTIDPSQRFQSIIQILDNKLGQNVHFLWGLSKDFGASGFRLGILYTQNTRLLQALANLNMFSGVPHPMQMIMSEILTDDEFVSAFLDDAKRELANSYWICTNKLQEMVIPFVTAEGGMFVYVDFSSLLPESTFEGEARFASLVETVALVVMTPGQSQMDCKAGMFRICYAWVPPDVLEVAMERLSCLVLKIRRNHEWDEKIMKGWKEEVLKCGSSTTIRRSRSVMLSDFNTNT